LELESMPVGMLVDHRPRISYQGGFRAARIRVTGLRGLPVWNRWSGRFTTSRRSAREALKPMTIAWLTRVVPRPKRGPMASGGRDDMGVNKLLEGKRLPCPAMTKSQMRCNTVGFEGLGKAWLDEVLPLLPLRGEDIEKRTKR
jgi:hypothetical protein